MQCPHVGGSAAGFCAPMGCGFPAALPAEPLGGAMSESPGRLRRSAAPPGLTASSPAVRNPGLRCGLAAC